MNRRVDRFVNGFRPARRTIDADACSIDEWRRRGRLNPVMRVERNPVFGQKCPNRGFGRAKRFARSVDGQSNTCSDVGRSPIARIQCRCGAGRQKEPEREDADGS